MKKVLVIAPHPDDETLGCGGTILKHKEQGDSVYWLIVTAMTENGGYAKEKIEVRLKEIDTVSKHYLFDAVYQCKLETTKVDTLPMAEIISVIGSIFHEVQPEVIYVPYKGDVHTDHKVVFDAVIACTKWFRYSSVKRVLVYETLSETDFGIDPDLSGFRPNVFVDISDYIDRKQTIARIYHGEMGNFPFPRSDKAIQALATLRGAASGCNAAEAFMLLKEIL